MRHRTHQPFKRQLFKRQLFKRQLFKRQLFKRSCARPADRASRPGQASLPGPAGSTRIAPRSRFTGS